MNIRQLFDGYRIENEQPKGKDPLLDYVLCHHGHIGVWGKGLLFASLDRALHLRGQLARLGRMVQDGSDGLTVAFPVVKLKAVCGIMEPRRQYKRAA